MGRTIRIANADRVNILNIGLMAGSCAVALFIPFQLFLFAYAVLGPAHYLTEISWLEKRRFFTRGRHDFWLLGGLAVPVFLAAALSSGSLDRQQPYQAATWTFLALGCALVLVTTARTIPRILGIAAFGALALVLFDDAGFPAVLLGLFVPTLVHVYLFTGFFIIYGALKERSRSGYAAFAVFLLCPAACLLLDPGKFPPGNWVAIPYWNNFSLLNLTILGIDLPHNSFDAGQAWQKVFSSGPGIVAMRFIAFAYTYHYLNWFSKTSVIGWHEVSWKRLLSIAAIWLASVGLFLHDYSLGFKFLFCLSLLHVYLEFPLNHISIMGTLREVRSLRISQAR